jgi:hypothetical protein
VVRGEVKTLQDSQKNVSTIYRKLYYKKSIPMGEKIPEWQNKYH